MAQKKRKRNYKREYEQYHSKPEQKKNRAKRNGARRRLERDGRVKKGDGKEIDHKRPLSKGGGNSDGNLRVKSRESNRKKFTSESLLTEKKLKVKEKRENPKVTKQLRGMKKFKAKPKGDVNSAIESAAHYAQKLNKEVYAYPSNRYGRAVWNTTDKESTAFGVIENFGAVVLSVTPDLTFTEYILDRPFYNYDEGALKEGYVSEKDIQKIYDREKIYRSEAYYNTSYILDEWDNPEVQKAIKVMENAIQQGIKKLGKVPYFSLRNVIESSLNRQGFFGSSVKDFFPMPFYVAAKKDDGDTIGILVHWDGKKEMFEGNDEASDETYALVNKLLGKTKPVKIWAQHGTDIVDEIKRTGVLPPNLYVSPSRKYAEGYWSLEGDRILFSGVIDSGDVRQESAYDWKTIGNPKIKNVRLY